MGKVEKTPIKPPTTVLQTSTTKTEKPAKKTEVQPPVKKRQISLDNTNMFDSNKKKKKLDFKIPKKNRPQQEDNSKKVIKKGDALEKVIKDLKKPSKATENTPKADKSTSKSVDKPYKLPAQKTEKTPQKSFTKTPAKLEKSLKKDKKTSDSSSGEKKPNVEHRNSQA